MNQTTIPDADRYRLLIEAITDYAICTLDLEGVVTSWNPGAQRFKGYAPSEIIGQHFSRFYPPADRKRGLPALALAIARRDGKFETEGWRVRKDGSQFWAYVVIDPIRAPSGDVIGFAKITRDLTERKAAEDTLRSSQEQFRLLVQGVTDYAIYLLDPSGRVSSWNMGAERIKGYAAHEIIGQHFSQFYTPEDRDAGEPQKSIETALKEGRFENEAVRVRKDGTHFWAHVVIDPIRDDDGELIGFAKITRDITERREAQAKLEKTRGILHQTQKMEAIGQLTGGIAHDFNNLLMAVLGSLALIRKRIPDDPKLLRLLENAVQGAERGTALTQRMLAFARRQEIKSVAVDVPDLVRGMTDMLQRTLGSSISIETRFPLGIRPVLADENQLEMALLNLAVNARDAMAEGGQIVIAAKPMTVSETDDRGLEPGNYICLTLTDTGTGMDEGTLQRAMEPFFTTKGVGKGTGLGLSMVHGITEQFGGRFKLQSKVGRGTTAELLLPVAASAIFPSDQPTEDQAVEARAGLVILAVDDDNLVLTNTLAMLEDLGHTGVAASSGREALNILANTNAIDLVITDQVMPQMTGIQLAKAIHDERPDLPVLLTTGYADIERGTVINLPCLSKPFKESELAKEIARIHPITAARAQVLESTR